MSGIRSWLRVVPYCIIQVLSRFGYATSGTVSVCTVSGIRESGTISYCTELERIGSIITTFESCFSVGDGSKSKNDLLFAEVELIFWFDKYND